MFVLTLIRLSENGAKFMFIVTLVKSVRMERSACLL